MEADIAQIKILLWVVIGLLTAFVAGNILCRVVGCGQPREDRFRELWQKGRIDALIAGTRLRLQEHPHDISALYFGAKALAVSGLHDSARAYVQRIMLIEPTLHAACREQLEAIDRMAGGAGSPAGAECGPGEARNG
ncbi:hypothetical protein [Coralloluteibacterium thermophilus]|uniref:Tetratricopeptide repeat protein n=1 Tax=Coralloluteibacterium thermophilum TaxID=2707049 RepID=A0ABV9NL16_9GAMM